ncbi:MAG TPA: PQQ-dependent sugar dehydrogenase [Polyangiaceae bacterium]|nr:PQQ-dependent sugar dehydrogenase [Polyangiaceae bacterium]
MNRLLSACPSPGALGRASRVVACLVALAPASGCWRVGASDGGGEGVKAKGARGVRAEDVHLPAGYRLEAVARGLTFPAGVAFDDAGEAYVVESGYSYGEKFTTPRLLRVAKGGGTSVVATGDDGPWTGVAFAKGSFFVAQGGVKGGGKVLRVEKDGKMRALVEGLPSFGDHHTNGPAVGPDGMVYFGQGTATNAGVVGEDNAEYGWLPRRPDFHDVPCRDVALAGVNFETDNPLTPAPDDKAVTGAYVAFGTKTERGQIVKGALPCGGAVMKVSPEGGAPELVAWGFRNPYGLAFSPAGRLFVTENGIDIRGSRPVFGAADYLYEVEPGAWYGWPDFSGGAPLTESRFTVPGKASHRFMLDRHPGAPPKPRASFGVHSSSNGLDFSRSAAFGHVGEAFVAQFGDMVPKTGKVFGPVGFKVVRVDVANGVITDFAVNAGEQNGPASKLGHGGLERPIACRFDPTGEALYVVDFGVMTVGERGPEPKEGTGVLWRIRRAGGRAP